MEGADWVRNETKAVVLISRAALPGMLSIMEDRPWARGGRGIVDHQRWCIMDKVFNGELWGSEPCIRIIGGTEVTGVEEQDSHVCASLWPDA